MNDTNHSHDNRLLPGWKNLAGALLDLVLPRRCAGCGAMGTWLCSPCAAHLPRIEPPICRRCGAPTTGVAVCATCWLHAGRIDGIRAAYYFDGALREMVHRFKYQHARHLAKPLAALLTDYLDTKPIPDVEALVPVPLHPNRLHERGYNQSGLLTREVSVRTSLPIVDDCLERIRDTPAQMSLPARQRLANVHGAFRARDSRLSGATVLLVDDVCTTGATLEACAAALKRTRVKAVWGVTLARARFAADPVRR